MKQKQPQTSDKNEKNLNQVIKIDEAKIKTHLGEMVRENVEEILNTLLDAEADQFCHAHRYGRTKARKNHPVRFS